ncbi:TonB-dependent receptor domain-containing protein [Aestuariispira ectoiniformans]|uniref:TonB-dependent receptor domain-containing protein n=1 Tax=Aestuariispira ectoiniformans TaxID=2775080 RepID=UPI00223AA23B|nr:TonB-dependent receptor [Aestuariispira ectoiniformans]
MVFVQSRGKSYLSALRGSSCLQVVALAASVSGVMMKTAAAEDAAVTLKPIEVTTTAVAPGGVQINEDALEAANPQNIKDVFEGETAVTVSGGSDAVRKTYVNGVEDTNLNVTIDGTRQVNSAFHHLGTSFIDPGLLKAVRVETGVGPADAGPGALGGSIAYETKDARDLVEDGETFGGFARLSYDFNVDGFSEGLAVAAKHGPAEAMIYGSMDGGHNYDDGSGNEVDGTAPEMDNLIGKFAWSADDGGRIEVNGTYLTDEGIRPARANFAALANGATPIFNSYKRKSLNVSYKDDAPTDMYDPEVVLSYNRSELFIDDLAFGPNTFDLHSETTSINGKLANTFTSGLGMFQDGKITVGMDFYHDTGVGNNEGGFAAVAPIDYEETSINTGAFAQFRMAIREDWRVSFGGRLDRQWFEGVDGTDIDEFGASGNINTEYDFVPGLTGYAGMSNTFGGIPLGEAAIYNFAGVWNYDGLKSSRARSYKVGTKFEHGPFDGDVNIYRTEIDGSHERGSATRNSTLDLVSKGINISGRYKYGDGYIRAGYTHNDFSANGSDLGTTSSSFHGLEMGDVFTLQAMHNWYDLGLAAGVSVEAALEDEDFNRDGYAVTNIHGEWMPEVVEDLTVRVDVKNLFDKTYVSRATAGTDSAAAVPFNEPGRTFLVSAKMLF